MMSARGGSTMELDPAIKLFDHITAVASGTQPSVQQNSPPAKASPPQRTHRRSLSEDNVSPTSSPALGSLPPFAVEFRKHQEKTQDAAAVSGSPSSGVPATEPPPPAEAQRAVMTAIRRASMHGTRDVLSPLSSRGGSTAHLLERGSIGGRNSHDHGSPSKETTALKSFVLRRCGKDPLGLQIAGGTPDRPGVFIKMVLPGAAAARDGRLRRGDRIVEVNKVDLLECQHADAVKALQESVGDVKITIIRRRRRRSKALGASTLSTTSLFSQSRNSEHRVQLSSSNSTSTLTQHDSVSNLDPLWSSQCASESSLFSSPRNGSPMAILEDSVVDDFQEANFGDDFYSREGNVGASGREDRSVDPDQHHDMGLEEEEEEEEAEEAEGCCDDDDDDDEDNDGGDGFPSFSSTPVGSPAKSSPATSRATPASSSSAASSPSKRTSAFSHAPIRKQGWLLKRGGGNQESTAFFHRKNWKRRFFTLQDTMLKYFKREPVNGDTAIGYVNIDDTAEVSQSDAKGVVLTSASRTLHLVAKTELEARQWAEALKQAAQQAVEASMA